MSETLTRDPATARRPATGELVLELDGIERRFEQAGSVLEVLRGASASVARGEIVALVGPSGAGKSTLLHIAGLLEHADGGAIRIGGRDAAQLNDHDRTLLRRDTLGFVYQFHHLLPEFSAEENIALPQMVAEVDRRAALARARELLALVGLSARASHRPARLSGGEQQRVAISRAFAGEPALLLADEPTGNLDGETGEQIIHLMFDLTARRRTTLVLITHDPGLAARCDRIVRLADGRIVADSAAPVADAVR